MMLKFSLGAEGGMLTVQREPGDHKAKASGFTRDVHGWGAEIHLLSILVRLLNGYGFTLASIKVADDGHLYGDNHMRYLRIPKRALRKSAVPYPYLYIIDAEYMLRSSAGVQEGGPSFHRNSEDTIPILTTWPTPHPLRPWRDCQEWSFPPCRVM